MPDCTFPDHVFLSLVGKSAVAVAAPLKTWADRARESLKEVVLICPESGRERVASATFERVNWFWHQRCLPLSESVKIRRYDASPDDLFRDSSWVRSLIENRGNRKVVFLASPGLKTAVAQAYRGLAECGVLHDVLCADPGGKLRSMSRTDFDPCDVAEVSLEDLVALIGFDRPNLTGLTPEGLTALQEQVYGRQPLVLPFGGSRLSALALERNGESVKFDAAFARRGALYLVHCTTNGNRESAYKAISCLRDYDSAYARLLVVYHGVGDWPQDVWVVGANKNRNSKVLERWLPPDPAAVNLRQPPTRTFDLALFLGPDPTPTLLSLFTHKPRAAVILWDRADDVVRARHLQLERTLKAKLPSRIEYLTSDRYGTNVDQVCCSAVDITPGTKAQAIALMRHAQAKPDTKVWSLGGGYAWPLGAGDPKAFEWPPLTVIAAVHSLDRSGSVDAGWTLQDGETLAIDAASKIIALASMRRMLTTSKTKIVSRCGSIQRHSAAERCIYRVRTTDGHYHEIRGRRIEVDGNGRSSNDDWGVLVEKIMARALQRHGVFDDIAFGISRPECDVVARLGSDVFVMEVKSGYVSEEQVARHVDRAYHFVGRYAIPVFAPLRWNESTRLQVETSQWARRCLLWNGHDLLGLTRESLKKKFSDAAREYRRERGGLA